MKKPNIKFLYSTAKQEGGARHLREVSPSNDDARLQVTYDNANLTNHLPFADKTVPDVLTQKERFKTVYQQE